MVVARLAAAAAAAAVEGLATPGGVNGADSDGGYGVVGRAQG